MLFLIRFHATSSHVNKLKIKMNITEITPEQAKKLLTEGALLLDVREKDEMLQTSFQIDGIENIPYSVFDEKYYGLPKNRKSKN